MTASASISAVQPEAWQSEYFRSTGFSSLSSTFSFLAILAHCPCVDGGAQARRQRHAERHHDHKVLLVLTFDFADCSGDENHAVLPSRRSWWVRQMSFSSLASLPSAPFFTSGVFSHSLTQALLLAAAAAPAAAGAAAPAAAWPALRPAYPAPGRRARDGESSGKRAQRRQPKFFRVCHGSFDLSLRAGSPGSPLYGARSLRVVGHWSDRRFARPAHPPAPLRQPWGSKARIAAIP